MAIADSRTPPLETALPTGEWHLSPSRSRLGFATKAMGLLPVTGTFSGYDGALSIDAAGHVGGFLRIDVESIDTGIRRRDRHLRSKDFFDIERHPHMAFAPTELVPGSGDAVTLLGTLTVRDREIPVAAPVQLAESAAGELHIDGEFEIDHRAAGFEFRLLPRSVRVQASLVLARLA